MTAVIPACSRSSNFLPLSRLGTAVTNECSGLFSLGTAGNLSDPTSNFLLRCFTFGSASKSSSNPVSWSDFKKTYLPQKDNDICKLTITKGQVSEQKLTSSEQTLFVVEPDQFELSIDSQLPINQVITTNSALTLESTNESSLTGSEFNIAPMGGKPVSGWDLEVICSGAAEEVKFTVKPVEKSMPLALWGDEIKPDIKSENRMKSLLAGVVITSVSTELPATAESVGTDEFTFQDVVENDPYWQWGQWETKPEEDESRQSSIENSLQGSSQAERRQEIGKYFGYDEALSVSHMANDLASAFIGFPQIIQNVNV